MSLKSIKKEYLIIGIVIVVLLAYLLLRSPNKMHYQLPQLELIPQNDITRVEIIKPKETLTLTAKDKKWFVTDKSYPADQTKIEKILKVVTSLVLTELRSTQGNDTLYGLGKTDAITVKVYRDQDVIREFQVGKVADTYNHTFVKLAGDQNIYAARTGFKSDFDLKLDELRDKQVLKFDKNEISDISITKGEVALQMAKKVTPGKPAPVQEKKEGDKKTPPPAPKPEVSWVLNDGTIAKKSEVDSLLNQLSNLSCTGYLEEKKKEEMKTAIYIIRLKGSKDYQISLFDKVDKDGEKYPGISSESPYVFLLPTYTADNLMKKPEALKEDKKEEKETEKKDKN